ncbi:MAG: hypothetical protein RSD95_07510 [Clostridia bacterium]
MRKVIEKYDGTRTYMFPSGVVATPEVMAAKYPAVLQFAHIIESDENREVCWAIQNLSAARSMNGIDPALSEAEAIAALEEIANAAPIVVNAPAAEERMAAALEYQNMVTLAEQSAAQHK